MADTPLDQLLGAQGEGFGLRRIVSDVSGVFGEGFGFSANSFLYVVDAYGRRPAAGLTFTLTWPGGQETVVGYDPAYLYLKTRPTNTPITITFAGNSNYQPLTTTVTIPAGGFRRLDLLLNFNAAPCRVDVQYF